MTRKQVFIFLSLIILMSSCLKEPQKPSWEVALAGPLFKGSLGIQNFFADSLIESDSNNVLHIIYRNILYHFTPDSILETPDTVTFQDYQSIFNINLQPGQLFLNKNEEKVYKFGQSKISRLNVKSGSLRLEVTNTLPEAVLMSYAIPSATKNGQSFEISELVPANATGANYFRKNIDISGYSLDMRGQTGLGANTLSTNLKARLNPNGVATQITTQDVFRALVKFEAFEVEYVRGYFESVDIDVDDESKMDVFNIIESGQVDFEDVRIKLLIENGFGIDARMRINDVVSKNTTTGNEVPLHTAILGQSINIIRATETGNPAVPVSPAFYPIDLSYSNVKQMLENYPDRLLFNISGRTNPLGNVSGGNDFYYDGYGMKIFLDIDIPLSLKTNALTLSETFDFEIAASNNGNTITGGSFQLIADNGFPFDAQVQLFLYDEADIMLDSLFFNNTVLAAPLNSAGMTAAVKRTIVDVPLPENKRDNLYKTRKMTLKIVFDTNSNVYVKLYEHYRIDLKLTGDFNFLVQQ